MQDRQSSITDLMDAYFRKTPGAQERLASLLRRDLVQVCDRLLGEGLEEAEDVAQDTLIAVFAYLERRGSFTGNLGAFAATVARNRCLDILRRRRRWREGRVIRFPDAEPVADPLDLLLDDELHAKLEWGLAELDPGCRKLLIQNYLKEKSIKWISRRIADGNLQFVYYRRRRCLQRLGEILNLLEKDVDGVELPHPRTRS